MLRSILNYVGFFVFAGALVTLSAKESHKEDKNGLQPEERIAVSQALSTIKKTQQKNGAKSSVDKVICELNFEEGTQKITTHFGDYRKQPQEETRKLSINNDPFTSTGTTQMRVVVATNDPHNIHVIRRCDDGTRIEKEIARSSLSA